MVLFNINQSVYLQNIRTHMILSRKSGNSIFFNIDHDKITSMYNYDGRNYAKWK